MDTLCLEPKSLWQIEMPDYVKKYPQLLHAIPRVHNMLNQMSSSSSATALEGHYELEARFGTLSTDGKHSFESGVPQSFMDHCLTTVSTYAGWQCVKDWEESHDYYYELAPDPEDLRGKGILVRTSVSFDNKMQTAHICKQVKDKQDFRFNGASFMSSIGMDIRVSLNFEETVPVDSIPSKIQPKHVRIKNRKSYLYQPSHADKPLWSIDFTKMWCGATRTEAELKQKNKHTIYEIEIECLDPFYYTNADSTINSSQSATTSRSATPTTRVNSSQSSEKRDRYYLATSLLLKMRDFVGAGRSFIWDPIYNMNY